MRASILDARDHSIFALKNKEKIEAGTTKATLTAAAAAVVVPVAAGAANASGNKISKEDVYDNGNKITIEGNYVNEGDKSFAARIQAGATATAVSIVYAH
jgi:hypothetical protein